MSLTGLLRQVPIAEKQEGAFVKPRACQRGMAHHAIWKYYQSIGKAHAKTLQILVA